jgi:hypothetical protein
VNRPLLNEVENIVSDVINEVLALTYEIDKELRLPVTRYHYIVKGSKKKKENIEEESPLEALFSTHNEVFTDIYMGRKPILGNKRSHIIYNLIMKYSENFDLDMHLETTNVGGFTRQILGPLLRDYGLYDIMDKVYEWFKNTKGTVTKKEAKEFRKIFSHVPRRLKLYALYYSLVASYYRLELESIKDGKKTLNDVISACSSVDSRTKEPIPIPDSGTASEIISRIVNDEILLDPDTLDKVSDNLLSEIITVRGVKFVSKGKSGESTLPFYRNPRGRIDPLSLVKSQRGFLDWEVYDEIEYSTFEREYVTSSPPDHFTALIDVSGSTGGETSLLAPIVGTDTTIIDAEKVIVLSMMKLTKRYGGDNVKASILLFSDGVFRREGSISEMIDFLLGREHGPILPLGGTEIVEAVKEGISVHKDRWDNPFILITDLEISEREERKVYKLIKNGLKRSPVLVVVIGGEIGILNELNKERNSAVVSVRTISDIRKLERAMRKISTSIAR